MLRTVSISSEARFAAIDRFRFWRVRLSELLIPTVTPPITRAKMKMPMTSSTIVKPASPCDVADVRRRCKRYSALSMGVRLPPFLSVGYASAIRGAGLRQERRRYPGSGTGRVSMRPMAEPAPRWLRIAVPAVILTIAAVVRLWGVSSPAAMYGDEQYYVFDAEAYLGGATLAPIGNPPPLRIADERTWVHPPLGKWIIALLGVGPLGLRSFGWRLPSALFGIAGVALLYLLALRLWRSIWWAGLASLLLALDGLHIVQSRIAMLDIFLTTFITAGMLFLVLDREQMGAHPTPPRWPRTDRLFGSAYRFWAGVSFGAAIATKWSGAFALVFAAALCAIWAFTGERRGDRGTTAIGGTLLMSFAVVPLCVYLVSYGSFFFQHGPAIRGFVELQVHMLQYQQHHLAIQPENSPAWTWPLMLNPIRYYRAGATSGVREIVALGNPVVWWGFLLLLPVGIFTVGRRPTWRDALIFGGYLAVYLPWFAVPRSQFFFYLLPAVPFMCLGLAAILHGLPPRAARAAGIVVAAVAVAAAIAFLPLWTGWTTSPGWIRGLRLLRTWPV